MVAKKVFIRCNGCKRMEPEFDYVELLTAQELGCFPFDISNPKHIAALQREYAIKQAERFFISKSGRFVRRKKFCINRVSRKDKGGQLLPLTIFLQIFYCSLSVELQSEFISYLNVDNQKPKSKMGGIGGQLNSFAKFEDIFEKTTHGVVQYLVTETVRSPASLKHFSAPTNSQIKSTRLAWRSPVPLSPLNSAPTPLTSSSPAHFQTVLIETIGFGIEKFYMIPPGPESDVFSTALTKSPLSPLKRSFEMVYSPRSVELPRGYAAPGPEYSPSGSESAFATPAPLPPPHFEGGFLNATPMASSSCTTPQSPCLWDMRDEFLQTDDSLLTFDIPPEELLNAKFEELIETLGIVTPNALEHDRLFQDVIKTFQQGDDWIKKVTDFVQRNQRSITPFFQPKSIVAELQQELAVRRWSGQFLYSLLYYNQITSQLTEQALGGHILRLNEELAVLKQELSQVRAGASESNQKIGELKTELAAQLKELEQSRLQLRDQNEPRSASATPETVIPSAIYEDEPGSGSDSDDSWLVRGPSPYQERVVIASTVEQASFRTAARLFYLDKRERHHLHRTSFHLVVWVVPLIEL